MLLKNPLMMIVMAFGVGCSELPPRERNDTPREAPSETNRGGEAQHIDAVGDHGDDVGGQAAVID